MALCVLFITDACWWTVCLALMQLGYFDFGLCCITKLLLLLPEAIIGLILLHSNDQHIKTKYKQKCTNIKYITPTTAT